MIVRPFAAADFRALVVLMRETLAMPALDEAWMARDFLLAPGFRAEHLLVAEAEERVRGFVLAPRQDALGPPDTGWIAGLGVAAADRGRGIGRALLQRAIADMRAEGLARIDVADVPVRYLLPGVDRVAFPAAFALLKTLGFATRDVVASMGIGLDRDFPTAPEVRPATPGELPLVRAFFQGWEASWWPFLERSTIRKLGGDSAPSDVLCWWEEGRPLGVVHFRGNRFGPLAVGETARGRGIGAALTLAALAAMRRAGISDAYFLIGRPEVQPFYRRLGFRVLREFSRMRLEV
jgi:ribosomal protein S18 acetylase RimI-like enzyme